MILNHLEDALVPSADLNHLMNTILRADQWDRNGNTVTVIITARRPDGWLEYGINVTRYGDNKQVIYIGAIQRSINAPSEFHS